LVAIIPFKNATKNIHQQTSLAVQYGWVFSVWLAYKPLRIVRLNYILYHISSTLCDVVFSILNLFYLFSIVAVSYVGLAKATVSALSLV